MSSSKCAFGIFVSASVGLANGASNPNISIRMCVRIKMYWQRPK